MTLGKLLVTIGVDISELDRGINNARKSLQRAGEGFGRVGHNLTMGVTLPMAALGAVGIKAGADLEQSLIMVQAITDATGKDFDRLREQAKMLGATTRYTAGQAAEGMRFLAMAGFDVEKVLASMPSTLQLAASANMDLARAADITTNIITGYRMGVEELPHANDVLVKTFTATNTTLEQLGEAFKYAGPVAKEAGLSFEETAAVIGLLGNAGIQASMAGTTLRGAITRMLDPTNEAAELMKELDINVRNTDGTLKGFPTVLREVAASGAPIGQIMALFGLRAGPGMASLLGQGVVSLEQLITKLEQSGGTAERVAGAQMKGLYGSIYELTSAAEGLAIMFLDLGVMDWLIEQAKNATGLIRSFQELDDGTKVFILTVGVLLASLGPLALIISAMIKTFTVLNATFTFAKFEIIQVGRSARLAAADFTLLGGGISGARLALNTFFLTSPLAMFGLLAAAVYALWKAVRAGQEWWHVISYEVGRAWNWVKKFVADAGKWLSSLVPIMAPVVTGVQAMVKAFKWLYDKVVGHSYVPDMVAGIRTEFATLDKIMTKKATTEVEKTNRAFELLGKSGPLVEQVMQRHADSVEQLRTLRLDLMFTRDAEAAEQIRTNIAALNSELREMEKILNAAKPAWDQMERLRLATPAAAVVQESTRAAVGPETLVFRWDGQSEMVKPIVDLSNTLGKMTTVLDPARLAANRARMVAPPTFMENAKLTVGAGIDTIVGALGNAFQSLLASMGPVAIVLELIGVVLEALRPAIEALKLPLVLVAQALAAGLYPVLKLLFPPIKYLGIAFAFVGEVIFRVLDAIWTGIGKFLIGIGKLLNKLPGSLGDPLIKAGKAMDAFWEGSVDAMVDARKQLQDLTFEDSLDRVTNAANKAAESLLNVPSGYKLLDFRRFEATGATPTRTATSTRTAQATQAQAAGQGAMAVRVDKVEIHTAATDGKLVYRQFMEEAHRLARAAFGDESRWPELD
jgi:TP901 family phage tail tape measure protein